MKAIRSESGQTLVLAALALLFVLIPFAALATDIGVMLRVKRLAQTAADSAAIAAASAVTYGDNASDAGTAAAAANGFAPATDSNGNVTTSVTISSPPADGYFATQTGYVEASITKQTPGFFMRVFGRNSMNVTARAVASYKGSASGCIYVLNPKHSNPAANPWGNSTISTPNCGIIVNGNIVLGASDSVVADYVGASGTITGVQKITGTYSQGIAPFSDPLSKLTSNSNLQPTVSGSSCSFPDGTKCYLNQPLTGTLSPGVYVYNQAVKFTGAVTGTGVTIMLLPGASFGTANANVNLTAPTSGSFNGILIDAPSYSGELNLDFGSSAITMTGIIYAPYADLSLQDQGGSKKQSGGAGLVLNSALIIGTLDVGNKNKGNLTVNQYSPSSGISPLSRIALVQ